MHVKGKQVMCRLRNVATGTFFDMMPLFPERQRLSRWREIAHLNFDQLCPSLHVQSHTEWCWYKKNPFYAQRIHEQMLSFTSSSVALWNMSMILFLSFFHLGHNQHRPFPTYLWHLPIILGVAASLSRKVPRSQEKSLMTFPVASQNQYLMFSLFGLTTVWHTEILDYWLLCRFTSCGGQCDYRNFC